MINFRSCAYHTSLTILSSIPATVVTTLTVEGWVATQHYVSVNEQTI